MPMPRSAIEVGSGTAGVEGVTVMLTVPVSPEVTPDSPALAVAGGVAVVKVHSMVDVLAVAAVKLYVTVFAEVSENPVSVRPPPDTSVSAPMGSTPGT
jgi:hypothetical protein